MSAMKALFLAMLMAVSLPVYAGEKETAARAEYDEGTTAYNLGHFDEAAQHYEAAYKLVHDPNMLFNIAQSYRQAEKPEQALPLFRSFLREAPADLPNRALAERFVEDLKRKIEDNRAKARESGGPEPLSTVANPTTGQPPLPAPALPESGSAPEADPLTQTSRPLSDGPSKPHPFYKAWWFWTAVGSAVVAGTVTAFLLARGAPDSCDGLDMKCVGVK